MRDMGCGVLKVAMGKDTDRKENERGEEGLCFLYLHLFVSLSLSVVCYCLQCKTRLQGRNQADQNQTLISALSLLEGKGEGKEEKGGGEGRRRGKEERERGEGKRRGKEERTDPFTFWFVYIIK